MHDVGKRELSKVQSESSLAMPTFNNAQARTLIEKLINPSSNSTPYRDLLSASPQRKPNQQQILHLDESQASIQSIFNPLFFLQANVDRFPELGPILDTLP